MTALLDFPFQICTESQDHILFITYQTTKWETMLGHFYVQGIVILKHFWFSATHVLYQDSVWSPKMTAHHQ